ncbi:MAG: SpoIIE family protein phosphatase [Leptospira sp.]|nr:SpoIIE family protein phosphatase [Leptospira sp.]
MVSRVPILIGKFSRIVSLTPASVSENSVSFEIKYLLGLKEKWYDVIFFKGLLEGAVILFQIDGYKIELAETRLSGIHVEHKELGSNIKFGSDRNIITVTWEPNTTKVGRTNLNSEIKALQTKTFFISKTDEAENEQYSFVDLRSVVDKSRQLTMENRDLETVVEVLNTIKTQLEIKQKSFTKDLRMARNIQKGIIPQRIPDWKGLQFWVKFYPLQEVSGDYYDYFNFGSSKLGILVSDVSGHGVPAAFITAISKLLFSNYKLDSPAEIFANTNRELLELVKQQGYLTCFYALFNSDYEITYSIAGHPRPILLRYKTKELIVLEGEGTYLGMFPDAREYYKDYKTVLEPGDKLFIYTDGLIEGMNVDGEYFGVEGLSELAKETAEMDVHESAEHIMSKFLQFCRGTDQTDDLTLLVVGLSPRMEEFQKHTNDAEKFYRNKNYAEACAQLLLANEILPREIPTLFLLGKYNAKNKNYKEAIRFLEEYNNLKTYNADAYLIQGYCNYQIGNYEQAEEELHKSMSLRNENFPAMYNLAKTYVKLNRKEDAIQTLLKILAIKDDFEPAILFLDKIRKL